MTGKRPSVFIGSSTEGLPIAKAIQLNLDSTCEPVIWSQGVFGLSQGTLETLVHKLNDFDFAVLVLTPDDLVKSRKKTQQSPRDNVLLELGLFIGSIGRSRTFIVYDRTAKLKLPTDLAGVTSATYQPPTSPNNLQAALGVPCTQIENTIEKLGTRKKDPITAYSENHLLELFAQCGLTLAFRIPVKDHEREIRVKELLETELASNHPKFRLLASSGYNYLHTHGKVWRAGLGNAITREKAKIRVVLQSPFSQFALTRALANNVNHDQWEDRGMGEHLENLVKKENVEIFVTGHPINCSLFFTSKAVFYDPYLWGRPNSCQRNENNFWVFEFENKLDPDYDCYHLLEKHFDFLAIESVLLQEVLGEDEDMIRYRELQGRFKQKVRELKERGKHDFAVCV